MGTLAIHNPNLPDEAIVTAYRHAAEKNVLAAVKPDVFFGYWAVCADGVDFGYGNSYPSLDGHQLADALLWLGQSDVVQANWDYVRGFQRADGCLPIAIFPSAKKQMGDIVDENGGLYAHWVPGDPLRALGATTYIQNADVLFRFTQDRDWLAANLLSVTLAADRLAALTTAEGCVAGAGYYVERPTRIEYDGVTQCHAVDAFRRVSALNRRAGDDRAARSYDALAERIADNFQRRFWVGDHFAEYLHPERGLIGYHGLTDVDWAALATKVATPEQRAILWPQLKDENRFRYGGMPTGISTRPESYEDWEFSHPDRMDLAAMGRVWYLECWARARMGDADGILETLHRVAEVGRAEDSYWRERYTPTGPVGARKYCEYPANLIRIVQRFVMGVEHELDGTLTVAPLVPARYYEAGFGQTLAWREQTLSYHIRGSTFEGTFHGAQSQRLRVRLNDMTRKIELPPSTTPVSFQFTR